MTWGEFKRLVEEKGLTDDSRIWYIDVSFPEPERVTVTEKDDLWSVEG